MDILSKFESVEVDVDTRISDTDKVYCEAHQQAYEAALSCFHELEYIWDDMYSRQIELLSAIGRGYTTYLSSEADLNISTDSIHNHIKTLHRKFLGNILNHFNDTYHITIDSLDADEHLFPCKPSDRSYDKDLQQKYEDEILNFVLYYENIVNFIFMQMDGRKFDEQAFHELKEKCSSAAWIGDRKKARFEIKKNILYFNNGCLFSTLYSSSPWELLDSTKAILRGIAHFETGDFTVYPYSFDSLLGYGRRATDLFEFSTCKKVRQLKMFKNGRVDIKFASEQYVRQFCDKYLGFAG